MVAGPRRGDEGQRVFGGIRAVLPEAAAIALPATVATDYLSRELSSGILHKFIPRLAIMVSGREAAVGKVSFCACAPGTMRLSGPFRRSVRRCNFA